MVREKNWQVKGGFSREDSDDELGYEDHPWQWVLQEGNGIQVDDSEEAVTPSRKRKASSMLGSTKVAIIGARMGSFHVRIGDAVLLKSPEAGKDWAGLICAFSDTNEDGDEEMCAHIMWFCSREELESSGSGASSSKKARALPDALANETYVTADFNLNPLTAINGKAIVMGIKEFLAKYPGGNLTKKGKAAAARYAKTIVCRRGVKQRNLRFTDEFEWIDIYKGAQDLLGLVDWVKENTKGTRRKVDDGEYKMQKENSTSQLEHDEVMSMQLQPQTPKKKRKTTSASAKAVTPKSSAKSIKFVTPTSKRIMIKKPLEFTPLGTRILSPSHYHTNSPYSQARSTLHVSAVPLSLPCRSAEFETVYSYLHSAIADGSGSCIYISGTPGTGKTATVREVVASLHAAVQDDELDDFNFVEINGMKVTEPSQSYSLLWEALKGDRVSPANALSLLEHEFSHPSPRRIPCVVLMDELDQLVTKSQSVMYNFFNWPSLRHSRLIVLAVANTMDLPERTLSNKISSRLGLIRITFPGYTHSQLMEIISSRLEGVQGLVDADAVQFAARKVAAVSGDARRALDICRRAVEIAEQQAQKLTQMQKKSQELDMSMSTEMGTEKENIDPTPDAVSQSSTIDPSKLILRPTSTAIQHKAHVTISTIKTAINEATSNPISQHLRSMSLSSKLFLAALLARTRRTGIAEAAIGDVLAEAKRIVDVDERVAIRDSLLINPGNTLLDNEVRQDKNGKSRDMPRVMAMGNAMMELSEAGIVTVDQRNRGERAGKVRLRIGDEIVVSAMVGDQEVIGWGFSA